MTSLLISIILWVLSQGSPNQIAERNRIKLEAERAFARRDYALSAVLYRQLTETKLVPEPGALFNLAHAYFALGDTARARKQYARLARIRQPEIAAVALSQLGVLTCRRGDSTGALAYFRRALEVLPGYEPARYNYELLVKHQSTPTMPRTSTAPPPKKSAASPVDIPRNPPVSIASDQRVDFLEKLRQYDLTEEKARMILEVMRSGEIQYIQQRTHTAGGIQMKQTW
ncbi:MAG: tetratricopeptide repeat protein [Cytophagaceae bacterium]|nr:tetratricopeptide repeat protein [Cytophagaceae bacterium]